jgi:hypothetical protein
MSERPSYVEAMFELHSILLDSECPVEVVDSVLGMKERVLETCLIELEPSRASLTNEFTLKLQASDLLLKVLAALRADNRQVPIVLKHGDPPEREGKLE